MKKFKILYNNISDKEKEHHIREMYIQDNKSFADIATELNTYANRIRRDAIKFNIPIRDKSAAQKNALKSGKHKHPTKGQKRDDITKSKIGLSVMKSWDNLEENELENRKQKSKERWDHLDDNTKKDIIKKANDAVRVASKTGSKLEKYIFSKLLEDGYSVNFHKEQTLSNTKLQIDLFLPTMNVAIEIDGPSHFLPVWGEDALSKNQKYDNKKQGLILGKGYVLIRVKQTKDFSKSRGLVIYSNLKNILDAIQEQFPEPDNRTFTIEDSDG